MLASRFVARVFWFSLPLLVTGAASAQEYPNRPIRIYTSEAGGGLDFISRILAQGMSAALRQPVVVDNRGGSGFVPGELTSKAPPDGHTLAMQSGTLWLSALMQDNIPYDAFRDFSPVTLVATSPSVLVVTASLPVKNVKDLIALAKARPGELNYVKISTGASNHLGAELFNTMAHVKIVPVPYKGVAIGVADLISGEVQVMWATDRAAGPHLKSGRLKALGVTSLEPSALFPGLPTVASGGLPGYKILSTYAMFAPAKTPEAVIRRLHQEVLQVLRTPDAKERLLNSGVEPAGSTPAELAALMKSDVATIGKVVKQAGIRVQ